MAKRQQTQTKTSIRESLTEQLQKKGADIPLFLDYIDKYLFYDTQERKMMADIRNRGIMVQAISAQGKEYERENPSIKLAALYNKQKLQILKELNLTTGNCLPADDGGGDL